MPLIGDLKEELLQASTFKFIAEAFTEAAAVKLKNIRSSFEHNKRFYDEISHVYRIIKVNAIHKGIVLPALSDPGKKIVVAVTSSLRFYGNLNVTIMERVLSHTTKEGCDLLVIGSTGAEFLQSARYAKPYSTVLFKKDAPERAEIETLRDFIKDYGSIVMFYPKFFSLLLQTVGSTDITHRDETANYKDSDYSGAFFEPELKKILEFFEHEMRSLLLLRVMLETELARTAARLMSMSAAEERTDRLVREKKSALTKLTRSLENTRLLETFAGRSHWQA